MATATIQILSGESAGRMVLVEGRATIGRDPGSTIRVNDRSISRKHAIIESRGDVFFLKDLNSNNGTRLNGEKVTETKLPDDCRLHFGTIEVQFTVVVANNLPVQSPPAGGAGEDDWQSLPHGQDVSLDDIFRPASLDEVDERETAKKSDARKKLLDLAYVLAMAAVVAIGIFLYIRIDLVSRTPKQEVIVARGSEALIPYYGSGEFSDIIVEDDSIVQVNEDEEYWWMLRVRGLKVGSTRVRFTSSGRTLGVLTAVVKGEPQGQETAEYRQLPESERIRRAEVLLRRGDQIRTESPWRALKAYEEAHELCRAIVPAPQAAMKASAQMRAIQQQLDEEVERLMEMARKTKFTDAPIYLQKILQLIPDTTDLRHRRAQIILARTYPEYLRRAAR